MKAQDIILQLQDFLVRQTNLFTHELDIISLTRNNLTQEATAVAAVPHGLKVGDLVTIVGAETPFKITTLTQTANIATAVTLNPHDFTQNFSRIVNIVDADQPEYNGEHPLVAVIDNKTFKYSLTGNPVSPATGNIFIIADYLEGYNGIHVVKSVSPDGLEFTYNMPENYESPAKGDIKARYNYRISGAATFTRVDYLYTKQGFNNLWAFVVLGRTFTSQDRATNTDAIKAVTRSCQQKHYVIESFSVYVFDTVAKEELSGRQERDLMEDIYKYLVKSLVGVCFPGVFAGSTPTTDSAIKRIRPIELFITISVGHDVQEYNSATYIHRFDFEQIDIILDPDIFPVNLTYPFRKIFIDYLNVTDNNLLLDDTILLRELE